MTEALKQALAELEACGSADRIARLLNDRGIRGIRQCSDACPVARFLRAAGVADAEVFGAEIDTGGETIPAPVVVAEFVGQFDAGGFPSLETTGSLECPPN